MTDLDLQRSLRDLGCDRSPPPGWKQRVLDSVQPRRRLADWFLAGVVVAVVIVGAVLVVWRFL